MPTAYGVTSMTAPLRRVLVRPPQPEDTARWQEYGWRAEPDFTRAAAEHEALRGLLEAALIADAAQQGYGSLLDELGAGQS